ncbi:MAG: SusC/RagA family TonB-linked outer membrane protein [Bacteroidota bacterium]
MRKLALFVLCITAFVVVHAQKMDVSGKVTGADGSPVSGASVTEKGTKNGVVAGIDGSFKISVNKGARLIISALGFAPTEVAANGNVSVQLLSSAASDLNEVVVTAQGIKRRPRELGYSVAKISNEEITNGRSPQLAQSLSGKVSGLGVYNVNNSVDPQVKITLRGYRSLTGNNDALIVIDGLPLPNESSTMFNLLNPNDIESVSVLKGGVAATLYGSQGINGAIVITTKKGTKGKARVTYTNATNFEQISFLPDFQTEFGSGSHYANSFGTAGYQTNYLDRMKSNWRSYENQQFGDRFDGSLRPAGRTLPDGSFNQIAYANVEGSRKKAFDVGSSMNNQVSVSGGGESTTYYLSMEHNRTKGITPGDEAKRTGARFAGSTETGRFKAAYNVAYTQAHYDRTTFDFYNEVINQSPHIDLTKFRNWRTDKFASADYWYNDYFHNPYFTKDNNRTKYSDANISGNIELNFKVNDWLNIYNKSSVMNNTRNRTSTTGKYIFSDWAKSGAVVPAPFDQGDGAGITRALTDVQGAVFNQATTENVLNNEFQIQAEQTFGDFSVKGLVGASIYDRKVEDITVSSSSIVVPEVYNISNRQGEAGASQGSSQYRKFGYYADLLLGWKDMVFVHGSGRYDFTSKFYKDYRTNSQYSYFYPGVDVSVILTELVPAVKGNILNYAKLRAGYNKNGNDNLGDGVIYGLDPSYGNAGGFPYGNTVGISVGDVLPQADLRPEFVKSFEVGGEFQMFNNRVNLDLTYYTQNSEGSVVTVKIPNSTGFPNLRLNVGKTKNWGYEADIRVQVIRSKKINWELSARYSRNDNKVIDLYPGINDFTYGGFTYAGTYVIKNESFPHLKAISYVRDPATNRVIVNSATGYPLTTGPLKDFGRSTPPNMLGWGTKFRYADFTLTANFEYRGGNVIYSDLGRQMTFTGSGGWTSQRAPFVFPNSSYDDGTGKFVPNTTVNTREAEYALWADVYRIIAENFVVPGWFIKMRDVSLAWNVPTNIIGKTKIFSGASISLYGRNLFTIVDKLNTFTDPEYSFTTGNGQGINTTAQTPPVRQFGFNVNLTFK